MADIQISLKAARINAGMTLIEAAKSIGIGKDTLLKWEKRPELVNPLFQSKISEAYNFPIDNIFFWKIIEFNSIYEQAIKREENRNHRKGEESHGMERTRAAAAGLLRRQWQRIPNQPYKSSPFYLSIAGRA